MFDHTGPLDNPTYFAGTSSLEPTSGQQSQDEEDALASDYLEPVATLPALLTENEKIEATSSHASKGNDQLNHFELNQVDSQKLDLVPDPKSADTSDEETSQNHDYALLDETSNKE